MNVVLHRVPAAALVAAYDCPAHLDGCYHGLPHDGIGTGSLLPSCWTITHRLSYRPDSRHDVQIDVDTFSQASAPAFRLAGSEMCPCMNESNKGTRSVRCDRSCCVYVPDSTMQYEIYHFICYNATERVAQRQHEDPRQSRLTAGIQQHRHRHDPFLSRSLYKMPHDICVVFQCVITSFKLAAVTIVQLRARR